MLTGIVMGSTAIALIFSPLGKLFGAHFNPAVTLTFWRLGKVKNRDAMFYIIAELSWRDSRRVREPLFVRGSVIASNGALRCYPSRAARDDCSVRG